MSDEKTQTFEEDYQKWKKTKDRNEYIRKFVGIPFFTITVLSIVTSVIFLSLPFASLLVPGLIIGGIGLFSLFTISISARIMNASAESKHLVFEKRYEEEKQQNIIQRKSPRTPPEQEKTQILTTAQLQKVQKIDRKDDDNARHLPSKTSTDHSLIIENKRFQRVNNITSNSVYVPESLRDNVDATNSENTNKVSNGSPKITFSSKSSTTISSKTKQKASDYLQRANITKPSEQVSSIDNIKQDTSQLYPLKKDKHINKS